MFCYRKAYYYCHCQVHNCTALCEVHNCTALCASFFQTETHCCLLVGEILKLMVTVCWTELQTKLTASSFVQALLAHVLNFAHLWSNMLAKNIIFVILFLLVVKGSLSFYLSSVIKQIPLSASGPLNGLFLPTNLLGVDVLVGHVGHISSELAEDCDIVSSTSSSLSPWSWDDIS